MVKQSQEELGNLGSHPIDFIKSLEKLPLRIWGRNLASNVVRLQELLQEIKTRLHNVVRQEMDAGIARPSMLATLLEEHNHGNHDDSIRAAAAMTYIAGADTTIISLDTFIIAMMVYPDAQKKGQEAIDNLLHGERLPQFSDRPMLPFLEALIKEVLRWRPAVPLGVPHRLVQDDEYKGYHLPKGSVIFPNVWQCMFDEDDFPEPSKFSPDRFMDGKVLKQDFVDPHGLAFGFGRRVCPGRHLADASLWIAMATLLAVFNISKPVDENGNVVEPDLEPDLHFGFLHSRAYRAQIKPRSSAALELLQAAIASQ